MFLPSYTFFILGEFILKDKRFIIEKNYIFKFLWRIKVQEKNKKESNLKWPIQAFFLTFILSGIVSFVSNNGIEKLNVVLSVIILVAVVLLGIVFDIIGVAVTIAPEEVFHAKATKKADGAKTSLNLIKNATKVANFCADVIGDICRSCEWCNKCNVSNKNFKYI